MSDDKAYAAAPAETLEQQIMDSRIAKSEAEWWASRTIEALRAENARLYEWKDKAGDMDRVKTVELVDLRAENARLREALNGLVDVAQYCDGINTSEQLRAARAAMGESDD